MQSKLNLKIKFRESFRPFAPVVLAERAAEWFELDRASPYMLLVAPVRPERRRTVDEAAHSGLDKLKAVRSEIPAVTHVDHSARIQTVAASDHPLLHQLLLEFELQTGCPVLVNTSFNVRDEPIVCTPADAYRCFVRTDMDALALGPFVIVKGPGVRLPPPDPAPREEREGDWSEDDPRVAEREPKRTRFFTFTLSALLALGAGLAVLNAHPLRAGALGVLAAAAFACAAAAPGAARRLFRAAMWLARKLSPVVTALLLGLVFFAVLTPVGLALRLLGRRPLDLAWRDGRRGFWVARESLASTVEELRRRF